jgi:hypothetical protein
MRTLKFKKLRKVFRKHPWIKDLIIQLILAWIAFQTIVINVHINNTFIL